MTDPFKAEMRKTPVWARIVILFILYWAFLAFILCMGRDGLAALFSYPAVIGSVVVSVSGIWTYAFFMRLFDRINKYISRPH